MCSLLQQELRNNRNPALLALDKITSDACNAHYCANSSAVTTRNTQDCRCCSNGCWGQESECAAPCARFADEVAHVAKQSWVPVPPYSRIHEGDFVESADARVLESSKKACHEDLTVSCRSGPLEGGIFIGTANGPTSDNPREGISGIRVISSAALARAAFQPCVLNLLRQVWVDCSKGVSLGVTGEGAIITKWVRPSYLKPNIFLSDSLRLWGNDALKRGRMLVAEYLYVIATCLLPSSEEVNYVSSDFWRKDSGVQDSTRGVACPIKARVAVLNSNRSLVLLRRGHVGAALRLATEAVLSDPYYRKAWYRRCSALERLLPPETQATTYSPPEKDRMIKCIIDELHVARENAAATSSHKCVDDAQQMRLGTCGCYHCDFLAADADAIFVSACNAIKGNYVERHVWIRPGVELRRGSKGSALIWNTSTNKPSCAKNSKGRSIQINDESLVLEEDAMAFYLDPPRSVSSCLPFLFSVSSENQSLLELHPCEDVRQKWERCIERSSASRMDQASPGNSGFSGEFSTPATDPCSGCGTVMGAKMAEVSLQSDSLGPEHGWLKSLDIHLRPVIPCVPCGYCATVLFCCHTCRDSSLHVRLCRKAVVSLSKDSIHRTNDTGSVINGNWQTSKETESRVETHSRALVFEDPQRHIAWQLLNVVFSSTGDEQKNNLLTSFVMESPSAASTEMALTASEIPCSPAAVGQDPSTDVLMPENRTAELLKAADWYQLCTLSASVALTPERIGDCLINAAWLAGAMRASGGAQCCGKRCIICTSSLHSPVFSTSLWYPLHDHFRKSAEDSGYSSCESCCSCCRHLCTNCVSDKSTNDSSDLQSAIFSDYPKCLFANAVHAYALACQNSFKMRVAVDPEDEAVAVGTAFFLVASRINHSCVPNALATFGQPSSVSSGDHGPRHGCATHLQVRITAPQTVAPLSLNMENFELCISYGPVVGEDDSSWVVRQRWLSKHASFSCFCEVSYYVLELLKIHEVHFVVQFRAFLCLLCQACAPPAEWETTETRLMFSKELLNGLPCPKCFSALGKFPFRTSSDMAWELKSNALEPDVSLLLSCATPNTQQFNPKTLDSNVASVVDVEKLVGGLACLLLKRCEKISERWTTRDSLALLGHSCLPLWRREEFLENERPCDSSRNVCKYISFDEYLCVHCNSRYPKQIIHESQSAVISRVDDICRSLNDETYHVASMTTPQIVESFVARTQCLVNITGSILKTCGYASAKLVHVFRELSRAHLVQYRVYRAQNEIFKAKKSVQLAASYLSSACYLQQLRLPIGLYQPEMVLPLYRLGMLLGICSREDDAATLLCVASKTARRAFGPSHLCTQSLLKHLKWLRSHS